jgi:hypothetical protein
MGLGPMTATLLASLIFHGTHWTASARVRFVRHDPEPAVHLAQFEAYLFGRVVAVADLDVPEAVREGLVIVAMSEFLDMRAGELVSKLEGL